MALAGAVDVTWASEQLQAWLPDRVPGATVGDVTQPAASGLSAETLLVSASWDGQHHELVVRLAPTADALFMDYDLAMEFRVLRALEPTAVPVPRAVFEEPDPAVLGAPFLVMERVDGRIAPDDPPFTMDGWVLELSPERQAAMCDNALRALAGLHALDLDELGLADVGHGDPALAGLDRLLDYWSSFAGWAVTGPNPTIEAGLAWVREHRPDASSHVLSWGDARIGNMIVAGDESIAAIIDWEMVAPGPRELDLGWWLFLLEHHSAGVGAPLPPGFPAREAELARYEQLTGHTVSDLHYFEVLAGVRMSILVARAATLMRGAGLIRPDSPMALVNPATVLLAGKLGLPAPSGDSDYYIGNR